MAAASAGLLNRVFFFLIIKIFLAFCFYYFGDIRGYFFTSEIKDPH